MVLSVEPLPESAHALALEDELRTLRQQYMDLAASHADLQDAAKPFFRHYRDLAHKHEDHIILSIRGVKRVIRAGDVKRLGRLLNGHRD